MIAIPAIDLREGACVQLVGGSYEAEQVRLDNPAAVASRWERAGFQRLHLVDLDAATSRGDNSSIVRAILHATTADVQAGGGVRDADTIEYLLRAGARHVVLGTRALEDPVWLSEMASIFPETLIVAADVLERNIVTRGWRHVTDCTVMDILDDFNQLPLAAVMVTAVHKEGLMQGADVRLMKDVAEQSRHPVIASGGIGSVEDLRALEQCGIAAVVIGMALYTGALDASRIAEEFAQWGTGMCNDA